MSAFVCKDETFSSVVRLLSRHNEIGSKDQLAQRLYLLNVKSISERYGLSPADDEYKNYHRHTADIKYMESERSSFEDWIAARCWMYQSCEGSCDQDTLFKAVEDSVEKESFRLVEELYEGRAIPKDSDDAYKMLWHYADENNINSNGEMWG